MWGLCMFSHLGGSVVWNPQKAQIITGSVWWRGWPCTMDRQGLGWLCRCLSFGVLPLLCGVFGIMNGNVCGLQKLQTAILHVRLLEILQRRILGCNTVKSQFLPSFGLTCVPTSRHKWNEIIISLSSGALDQFTWNFHPVRIRGNSSLGHSQVLLGCCSYTGQGHECPRISREKMETRGV